MEIRAATAADWPRIWPFLRATFAEGRTYTVHPGIDENRARAMWMLDPPGHTLVAVKPGPDGAERVVGSAKTGPNQGGPGAHVATASFVVDPDAAGRGTGRALGVAVLEWARRAGFRSMQFNAVVATNTRALGLWRSLGFETVGIVPEAFALPDGTLTGLHVMHRVL